MNTRDAALDEDSRGRRTGNRVVEEGAHWRHLANTME